MDDTASIEWNGLRVTYPPASWAVKTLSGDVVLVPREFSQQEIRSVPASVVLRDTPLLAGMKFGPALRHLMDMRQGQARFELESAPEAGAGAFRADWSDGITEMRSVFVERPDSFVEIIYRVAFSSRDFSLERLMEAIRVERF
jgi:hypothetical protein